MKEERVVTENGGLEEMWGFLDNSDEEVSDGWGGSQEKDDPNEEEGTMNGAHLAVVQGEADRDVTLHGHTRQDEWGGAGGEDSRHDLRKMVQWSYNLSLSFCLNVGICFL